MTCPICIQDFSDNTSALECGHVFDTECVRNWVQRNKECPICRAATLMSKSIRIFLPRNKQTILSNECEVDTDDSQELKKILKLKTAQLYEQQNLLKQEQSVLERIQEEASQLSQQIERITKEKQLCVQEADEIRAKWLLAEEEAKKCKAYKTECSKLLDKLKAYKHFQNEDESVSSMVDQLRQKSGMIQGFVEQYVYTTKQIKAMNTQFLETERQIDEHRTKAKLLAQKNVQILKQNANLLQELERNQQELNNLRLNYDALTHDNEQLDILNKDLQTKLSNFSKLSSPKRNLSSPLTKQSGDPENYSAPLMKQKAPLKDITNNNFFSHVEKEDTISKDTTELQIVDLTMNGSGTRNLVKPTFIHSNFSSRMPCLPHQRASNGKGGTVKFTEAERIIDGYKLLSQKRQKMRL